MQTSHQVWPLLLQELRVVRKHEAPIAQCEPLILDSYSSPKAQRTLPIVAIINLHRVCMDRD